MDTGTRIESGAQKFAGTAFATLIVLLASCGGGGSAPTTSPLVLSPAVITLDQGTSHQFTASGGQPPYNYSLSGPGSIDSQSGTYSAPDTAGSAVVRVSDHAGASSQSAVTINPPLTITPAALAVGTSVKLTGQGGSPPYVLSFESGTGSFDPSSGIYTAPASPGTATIAITDSLSVTTHVQIAVNPALSIVPTSLTLTASSNQTYPVTGVGGGAGYTYSIVSGSGTVDANGVYTAGTSIGRDVLQVRDAQGATATAEVQLLRADTNGPVDALIVDPAGTYLGGSFTTVHPYVTSRIAAVDPVTGHPNLRCDLGTGFDATVRTFLVVGDSLYVGGDFTKYKGQPAHALAKLDAKTCALDSNFTESIGLDGDVAPYAFIPPPTSVAALASSGSSLYVGGNFSTYRQAPAGGVAKLDLSTGELDTTFTQANGVDGGAVTAIAASTDAVFVAGFYQHYRGTDVGLPHGFPMKLNAVSGDIDPTFQLPSIQGGVATAMMVSDPWLYVAGNFTPGIQKLDLHTGTADPLFAQNIGNVPAQVNSIALSGNALFLAGGFTSIGGVPAQYIAKVDALSGKADPTFNRASAADQIVWGVATNSNSVYIVGNFQNYAGQAAPGFARLDADSGALDTTFGLPSGFPGGTPTSLAASGDSVYVGGSMVTYGGTPAAHIARFDPVTGTEDTQFLAAGGPDDGFVTKMLLAGQTLYVGGNFSNYAGVAAGMLVKLDSKTGSPDRSFSQGGGFSMDTTSPLYGGVNALALSASSLYVGGFFTGYRGQPVSALAKLDAASGNVDTVFNQPVGFTEATGVAGYDPMGVTALALAPDALYVAGNFAGYRGTQRYLLAKLDPISGNLNTQFAPAAGLVITIPYSPATFNTLLISGNNLYAGGGYVQLPGGQLASGLAKFDATTGSIDVSFVQTAALGGNTGNVAVISDLALAGSSLYVAGNFARYLNGLTYAYNLAKLDATSGTVDETFTQAGGPDYPVYSLVLQPNSLLINGSFDMYRGDFAGYSTALDLATGSILDVPQAQAH